MIEVFVAGVAVRAPGLPGWAASLPILTGAQTYVADPIVLPPPSILAPNERRRAGQVTRLALAIAEETAASSGLVPNSLSTVFASSNGDGQTIGAILDALTGGDGQVSPTQFHNSIHNAPAGYWSIGVRSGQAATCLGCNNWTAAAALMKAAAEACVEKRPVLMCLYDVPLPKPLDAFRPMSDLFGMGLLLLPVPSSRTFASLRLAYHDEPPLPGMDTPRNPDLARLTVDQPMAHILRLLEAIAASQADRISLALLDGRIDIEVAPYAAYDVRAEQAEPCSTASASRH